MMLTWKIFVTIMSMVSFTLQMDSSAVGPSSNSSPLWVHDKVENRYYPARKNIRNPFNLTSKAHVCYALLTLYCRTENRIVSSNDCLQQGILDYDITEAALIKVTKEHKIIPQDHDPISWLDNYFFSFQLDPGAIKYPQDFCVKEDGTINSDCLAELQEYSDEIETPDSDIPRLVAEAKYVSRSKIAVLALRYKVILRLPEESFEKKYLKHISENVLSIDVQHDPYSYCFHYTQRADGLKISKFLVEHLGLIYF